MSINVVARDASGFCFRGGWKLFVYVRNAVAIISDFITQKLQLLG